MRFDRQRVESNVRQATTEDLLDRITVFAAGMEGDALEIIEAESPFARRKARANRSTRGRTCAAHYPAGGRHRRSLQLLSPSGCLPGLGLAPDVGSATVVPALLLALPAA